MDDITISLLTSAELEGKGLFGDYDDKRKLEVFRKMISECDQSDLCVITGAKVKRGYNDIPEPYSALTATSTMGLGEVDCFRNSDKRLVHQKIDSEHYAIRPVLTLPPDIFDEVIQNKTTNKQGIDTVCFGFYLQKVATKDIQKKLDSLRFKEKLKKCDGTYTLKSPNEYMRNELRTYRMYEYKGKKYANIRTDITYRDGEMPCYTIYGINIFSGSHIWVEEEPVEWLIDYKTRKLIAANNLLSGIRYDIDELNDSFDRTEMYEFLNKYMLTDLLQYVQKRRKAESDMVELIKSIDSYRKYLLSEDTIKEEVDSLIEDYNRKIDELERIPETSLKVGYKDADSLSKDLIMDLNRILNRVVEESKISRIYLDMIEILECTRGDEICDMICTIRNILNNTKIFGELSDELLNELDSIINQNINRINGYLRECKETKKNTPNKTLDSLKLEFRRDIQPYLVKLHNAAVNSTILDEINELTKSIINNQYVETSNKRSTYLLDLISEVSTYIKLNGTKEEIKSLKEIVNYKIDGSKDILDVLKELNDIFRRLCKIELDIKDRYKTKRSHKDSKIKINTSDLFTEENNPKMQLTNRGGE